MSSARIAAVSFLSMAALLVSPTVSTAAKKSKAKPVTTTLTIENLTASSKPKAIKKLEKTIKKVKGVVSVKANKKKGVLIIKHAPLVQLPVLKAAVVASGFKVVEPEKLPDEVEEETTEDSMVDEGE